MSSGSKRGSSETNSGEGNSPKRGIYNIGWEEEDWHHIDFNFSSRMKKVERDVERGFTGYQEAAIKIIIDYTIIKQKRREGWSVFAPRIPSLPYSFLARSLQRWRDLAMGMRCLPEDMDLDELVINLSDALICGTCSNLC
jgi:hypothetical protein